MIARSKRVKSNTKPQSERKTLNPKYRNEQQTLLVPKKQTNLHVLTMTTRKLPLILLLMIVIASTVSFLPVQEARASIELAYDDGIHGGNNLLAFVGVKFSLPSGVSKAQLITVRFGWSNGDPVIVHITAADHVTELTTPIPTTGGSGLFTDLDVSSLGIIASGDFYVILEHPAGTGGNIKTDTQANVGQSFNGLSMAGLTNLYPFENFMIRAVIDVAPAPVGGIVTPVNKLEILTPYLALAGLIVAVSAVVVVKRRD